MVTEIAVRVADTRTLILDAARSRLLADGYAGLSTRKVAEEAGVPLSQLHYHFGSKQGLILALFEEENQRRLARQQRLYAEDAPLWQRYERACDYLEDDLDSGYVRVLQEMIAASWSNQELGSAVRELLEGWFALLADVARETERRHGPLGPFTVQETATLIGTAFIGSESLLLLGFDRDVLPIRSALRRIGVLIRQLEEGSSARKDSQMRACLPNRDGYVERDGVKIYYEVFGAGEPTVLLQPTWSIVHSRHWKMQIPYLARHCRVVTFDGRGNGRSDRPTEPDAYREEEFANDALAVMDATGTERAVLVSLSRGAERSLHLAASHPERVDKLVFIAPALPLPPATPRLKAIQEFGERHETYLGWGKWNRHYWLDHYEDFLEFFFSQCFTEPHSTKPREDCVGWGLETDPETLVATQLAPRLQDEEGVRELLSQHRLSFARDPWKRRRRPAVRFRRTASGACRRPARRARGVGPPAPLPRPGQGQPAPPRLHQTGTAAAALGPREVT